MFIYQVERDLIRKTLYEYKDVLGGKVLDAGGGSGKKYQDLMKKGGEYLTLDINSNFNPDIVGSVENIPVLEHSFDSIICTQVIGDLLYPQKAVKEFSRVLKFGGKIILTEGFMNELHGEPRDFWRFTPYSLRGLFEENGFKVLEIKNIGGFFSVIAQMITRFFINTFDLYEKKILGRIFGKFFVLLGKISIVFDKFFVSKSSCKFCLDFIVVAELIKK